MNSTLTTHKDRRNHPPEPPSEYENTQRVVRRVGIADRVALHLGVALITWSRRPRTARLRATAAARAQQQLTRERLALARAREEHLYPRFIIR
ncbi:hypothetical protein A20C1_05462 [marine actinobacterium PHSC20C1]|nr:hypothetical protein A20C1_05462 [marine actinobacterium PHSC20C1]